jgi:hypothetical protein
MQMGKFLIAALANRFRNSRTIQNFGFKGTLAKIASQASGSGLGYSFQNPGISTAPALHATNGSRHNKVDGQDLPANASANEDFRLMGQFNDPQSVQARSLRLARTPSGRPQKHTEELKNIDRKRPQTSTLILGRSGRPRGLRILEPEREGLIHAAIQQYYLTRERPAPQQIQLRTEEITVERGPGENLLREKRNSSR